MAWHYEYECRNCDTMMEFEIDPGYSTAHVRNPNHPSYSDPGDPGYVDGPEKCPNCDEKVDHDDVMEKCVEAHEPDYDGPEPDDFDYGGRY